MSELRANYDLREYEAAKIIERMVGEKQKILNVGASWGRDYHNLENQGKDVTNIDISPYPGLENVVEHDANEGLPFENKAFDAVILPEILEHLTNDFYALKESKRLIKDNGVIVISVPYGSDEQEKHLRIYSEKTIKRLVKEAGLKIERYIERGGIIQFSNLLNRLIHPDSKNGEKISRCVELKSIYDILVEHDIGLSDRDKEFLKNSRYNGGYIKAVKKDE